MMFPQQKRTTNVRRGSRIPSVIAIASFVVMAACGEPTGPRTICCTPEPQRPEQIVNAIGVLADELHDAADVFAQGAEDKDVRSKSVLAVNQLADNLKSGKVQSSRASLFQARLMIAGLNDTQAIDLAPVVLALDYIERRMNEILNSGA